MRDRANTTMKLERLSPSTCVARYQIRHEPLKMGVVSTFSAGVVAFVKRDSKYAGGRNAGRGRSENREHRTPPSEIAASDIGGQPSRKASAGFARAAAREGM